jgi:DNA-directed RNA polymerase specialized sigma24 family protein
LRARIDEAPDTLETNMHDGRGASRAALIELRLASDRLLSAAHAQRREVQRAQDRGASPSAVTAGARPAGAPTPAPGTRRRFTKDDRESLEVIARATEALRRAREDQRSALRRARHAGFPLEVIAAEARVSVQEIRRVTERVPAT